MFIYVFMFLCIAYKSKDDSETKTLHNTFIQFDGIYIVHSEEV